MNRRLLSLLIKGIFRRYRETIKVSAAVFFSFVFVTGILLFQENMYNWQIVKAKEHFGDWFIMDVRTDDNENEMLALMDYLDKSTSALTVNELYNSVQESLGIYVGSMSASFIKNNNITIEQGRRVCHEKIYAVGNTHQLYKCVGKRECASGRSDVPG